MEKFKTFISNAIENHILDIDHRDYEDIEKIVDRKELNQLSFYLESEQDDKPVLFSMEQTKNPTT